MPQMSPILWFMILLLTFFTFMNLVSLVFFNYNINKMKFKYFNPLNLNMLW